jgi:hypothetical protein
MIIECIKEGLNLAQRNWQLVLLKIVVAIINLFLLFVFIGVPLVIVIASLGIDFAYTKDLLPGFINNPTEILSKYLGIVLLIFAAFTLYICVVSVITLYTFGGTIGVLRTSALNLQYKFSLSSFFQEARTLFFPLLWLLSLLYLFVTLAVIFLGILTGTVFLMIHIFGDSGSTIYVFTVFFFSLLLIFLAIAGGMGIFIYAVYSIMSLVVDRKGVMESLKTSWSYLKHRPRAFLFYIVLILGIFGINICILILGGIIQILPVIGVVIAIPYQLIYYVIQVYLGVFLWSSMLIYYIKDTGHPVYNAEYNI